MKKTIKLIVMAALCLSFPVLAQQPEQQRQPQKPGRHDTIKTTKDTIKLNEVVINTGYYHTLSHQTKTGIPGQYPTMKFRSVNPKSR